MSTELDRSLQGWSVGLDIAILAKTALIIFRDPQAY